MHFFGLLEAGGRAFKEWGPHDGVPLLFVRKQLGAASPPSTDLISSPEQDMDMDNLGGNFGRSWLILLLFQPYHQCLCHFVFY